jgi:hypothetical protein
MLFILILFEIRVLKRIFRPRRDEIIGGWKTLYNEELHYMYYLPNIIIMMRSRRMSWAGRVAHMGRKRDAYRVLPLWEIQKGRDH